MLNNANEWYNYYLKVFVVIFEPKEATLNIIFVASEASDLIFKIVIFLMYPKGPQLYTQCFPELAGEEEVEEETPPRQLGSRYILTLYAIGLQNRGMTFPRPVGRKSKYRLKVIYSIEVSGSFESPAPNLEASVHFL